MNNNTGDGAAVTDDKGSDTVILGDNDSDCDGHEHWWVSRPGCALTLDRGRLYVAAWARVKYEACTRMVSCCQS